MASNGIECAFHGTVSRDIDHRVTKKGDPWLLVNAAVSSGNETQWVTLMIFGDQVPDLQNTLEKGMKIYAEGPRTGVGLPQAGRALRLSDVHPVACAAGRAHWSEA